MISALAWVPRGGVKRVPVRQELSPEELVQLRDMAGDEEEAAGGGRRGGARRGGGDDSDDDSDDGSVDDGRRGAAAPRRCGKKAAGKGAAAGGAAAARRAGGSVLDDPAYASLRDVALPFAMSEDGSGSEDGGDDDDDGGSGSDSSGGGGDGAAARRRNVARAVSTAALEASVVGNRMDGLDAPATFDDADIGGADGEPSDADDAEDVDDLTARPTDAFLLVARTEDDYSGLEVQVYNTAEGSLHTHHDVALPALPLALAWMDYAGSAAGEHAAAQAAALGHAAPGGAGGAPRGGDGRSHVGSYVAVGTFKPDIEIWNLDVMDPLEPSLVLRGAPSAGGAAGRKGRGGKGGAVKRAAVPTPGGVAAGVAAAAQGGCGHSDAVMGLSWNRAHRHMLASGSADRTAKIWDLDAGGRVLHTYTHHKGKVQAVAWNPAEASVLAMASYDRTISVADARAADKSRVGRYALPADSEAMVWGAHNPAVLMAACEDGSVLSYDVRSPGTPLWCLPPSSHGGKAVSAIGQSLLARGLIATGGLDKTVRLWDAGAAAAGGSGAPVCIATKAMPAVGQIFTLAFFPNAPFLLGAGGSEGTLAVWDVAADGGDVPYGLAPPADGGGAPGAGAEGLLPPDASPTARRFAGRLVGDPTAIPGNPLALRARADPQPVA